MISRNDFFMIEKCRVCGSSDVIDILDLGIQPLANSLKCKIDQKENKYPLTLSFCQNCSLVQLRETIKKEILFDTYLWVTGTSETAKSYANIFCERVVGASGLQKGDLVVEVASNDGTFLKPFQERGYDVIGIEPAKNIVEMARQSGIRTFEAYWNLASAQRTVSDFGYAHVIYARNVIPHVSDLHGVIQGVACCLDPEGVGIIEFHYSGIILEELHYDSIYHEHLCYFSIHSLEHLLNKFNLFPFHIDLSPISGGSYVIYFSKTKREKTREYEALQENEDARAVNSLHSWRNFADKCRKHREHSRKIVESLKGGIVGFGASARSSTYLNFCGFTSSEIGMVIDNNLLKQGLCTAGSSIPIVSFQKGFKEKPNTIFILAWNFRDEVIKQCEANGFNGDYLIPFPNSPHIFRKES